MCGGDDHLAWKRLVSSEACKGLRTTRGTPSSHVGASESLQSHLSHYLDPVFSLWFLVESAKRSRIIGGRLIIANSHQSSDSSVEISYELAATLASIQEFMVGVNRRLDQIESSRQDPHPVSMVTDEIVPHASQTAHALPPRASLGIPFYLVDHYETIPPPTIIVPPPIIPTTDDTRLAEDGKPVASFPAKFSMPDIERYSGIGCPKIHLRLYSTVMRAHGIDDAQLWPLPHVTYSLSVLILMYLDESWRPSDRGQMSLFHHLAVVGGQRILKSLVHVAFSVEEAFAQGLWTDTAPFPDNKGKRSVDHLVDLERLALLAISIRGRGHDIERCAALHHAIQDLIDSRLVNLSRPSVTTNPLPTHSTHVEDLDQSTWVHHFAAVQLITLFILIMVVIRVVSILLIHVESLVVCSPLSFHT
ncbi:hypothetical protein CK203_059179 [Vitis vinifera]|uniref:Uncharacterized protein n=1 Tax=Vitis vinifera TaxID=29760 RepID=A0A438GM22_VITVI|nr:hypothetical protein CK203_059179 [Vitis vinifera]